MLTAEYTQQKNQEEKGSLSERIIAWNSALVFLRNHIFVKHHYNATDVSVVDINVTFINC